MKGNKLKKKGNKKELETYASYISDYIDGFENKDDLVFKLDKLKNTRSVTYATPQISIKSNQSCVLFVESLDENNFKLFEEFFNKKIDDKRMNQDYLKRLEDLVKDYDIYIIDLVVNSKTSFGIKVQVLDQVYLFEFKGTLKELSKDLIDEYNKLSKHKIFCPYCNKELSLLEFEPFCECGIHIIHEVAKPNNISHLVEESGGKEFVRNGGWKVWFLDDESMKKFEYIKGNEDKYFNEKFDEYIKNNKYKHINSDDIIDTKFIINGMEITITRKDYFKFISKICLKYCDWVRNGSLYDIGYSNDSYYSSDNLELISKGNMYKNITSFKTVSEWISECYVGNNYDTFYDYVRENINFEGIIYEKMNITEDDEIYEELIESDEVFDVGYSIECVVMDYFDEMTTLQCWNDYKDYK